MFRRYRTKFSITFLVVLLVSSCSGSKEVKRARDFIDAGMFDQAVAPLKQEIQTNPKNAEAHLLLGTAYFGNGMIALAEQELNTAMQLDNGLAKEAGERCYGAA